MSERELARLAAGFARRVTTGRERKRERASDLASSLLRLAKQYPEFRRELRSAQGRVSQQGWRSPEHNLHAVIQSLASGATQTEEISDETNIPVEEVQTIVDYLIEAKRVEARPRGGETDVARGERESLYFLCGTPAGSSYTAPRPGSRYEEPA